MHRPAAGDLDMYFGRALDEQPELRRPARAPRRARSSGATTRRRATQSPSSAAGARGGQSSPAARRRSAGSATSRTRSRRTRTGAQTTWKRVAVIVAGPGDEHPLRGRPLRGPLHGRRRQRRTARPRSTKVRSPDDRQASRAPADRRPAGGRPDRRDQRRAWSTADRDRRGDLGRRTGKPLALTVAARRRARRRSARSAPEKTDGVYRLGFVLAASARTSARSGRRRVS